MDGGELVGRIEDVSGNRRTCLSQAGLDAVAQRIVCVVLLLGGRAIRELRQALELVVRISVADCRAGYGFGIRAAVAYAVIGINV